MPPPSAPPLLFNGVSTNYEIAAGSNCWAWTASKLQISRTNSYLVSFLVNNAANHSDAAYWTENHTGAPGSWLLPATLNPNAAMTAAAGWNSLGAVQSSLLYGVYGLYTTCPTNGYYYSPIVDTQQTTPSYLDVNWASILNGGSIALRVRTGAQPDLSDAPAWTNVTALVAPGSIDPSNNGRYVQFQAQLQPNSTTTNSPSLGTVTVRWTGTSKAVDIGGTFSQGPDHGIWQLAIDGQPLLKGCTMNLTIYQNVFILGGGTRKLTSTVSTEIYPRNTGK